MMQPPPQMELPVTCPIAEAQRCTILPRESPRLRMPAEEAPKAPIPGSPAIRRSIVSPGNYCLSWFIRSHFSFNEKRPRVPSGAPDLDRRRLQFSNFGVIVVPAD